MRKLFITSIVALSVTPVFASDYLQQEVTSEVYYSEQVQYTEESYVSARPQVRYQAKPVYQQKLAPVTVHTGRTVTVQDHYDVYQPRIVYDKVDSYTTTKTCTYCN